MRNDINNDRDIMDAVCLDLLAKVALEWEEEQASQSLLKKGGKANTKGAARNEEIP